MSIYPTMLRTVVAATIGVTSVLWAGAAHAAHPATVQGVWSATANQTLGALVIVQPASGAVCKPITGTIFGNSIQGYYCPATGRLVFARRTAAGVPFQLYEGHVARDAAIDRVGGSFLVWNNSGGGFANEGVDFNFSATK